MAYREDIAEFLRERGVQCGEAPRRTPAAPTTPAATGTIIPPLRRVPQQIDAGAARVLILEVLRDLRGEVRPE